MQIKIFIRHVRGNWRNINDCVNRYVIWYNTLAIIYLQSVDQKQFSIRIRGYISRGSGWGEREWEDEKDPMSRDICGIAGAISSAKL